MIIRRKIMYAGLLIFAWTFVTYFIFMKNNTSNDKHRSKLSEKLTVLEDEIRLEAQERNNQLKKLETLLKAKPPTSTTTQAAVNSEQNVDRLYNTINFKERYLDGDPNRPVIPVIVFACNRVSVSKCLDNLVEFRPNKEQFPIIVSQVRNISL